MNDNIKSIRKRIDALDQRLVKLLSARARLAQRVGKVKAGAAYRPEREAQVLRGILKSNPGPLSGVALARLFTDDGFVLQPGRQPARGRDEIVRAYTGSGGPLALRALAYATAGDIGYIVGAYSGAVGRPDDGKFILLVRRAPGGPWKIAADMDSGNRRR